MRSDLDAALVRDFPALYRDRHGDSTETRMCDGFPGDGWEPLIRRMSERLEPFCTGTDLHAEQVKEKVGALRVCLNSIGPIPDDVRAAVAGAVEESRRTCEGCCAAGLPRKLGWIRTLCADCATFAAEFEQRRFGRSPADEEWREQFRDESGRILIFEDALRLWRSRAGTNDPTTTALAEFHQRRLSRDTISGEELSERLGIDPREEAKWRRAAEEEEEARPQLGLRRDVDDRPEVRELFANLKASLPALETLLDDATGYDGEDGVYRFYHQSFKVFDRLRPVTSEIVDALQALAPNLTLNEWFMTIVQEGTGKEFKREDNARWLEVTRPIVEAFFHARYFLEQVCAYGRELDEPPTVMPSGWAAALYLYGLR